MGGLYLYDLESGSLTILLDVAQNAETASISISMLSGAAFAQDLVQREGAVVDVRHHAAIAHAGQDVAPVNGLRFKVAQGRFCSGTASLFSWIISR